MSSQTYRPWVEMARLDGREWFRDHPGAPLDEYDDWAGRRYEPYVLRAHGYVRGRLTRKLNELLDCVQVGLARAAEDEWARRGSRVA